jgi:hypothetical protein
LECGGLPALYPRELARGNLRPGQQAGLKESGSPSADGPHSKAETQTSAPRRDGGLRLCRTNFPQSLRIDLSVAAA